MFGLFALLFSGLSLNAQAAEKGALVRTHGYVSPRFQAVFRPDARPVDQSRIGMSKSKAGLIFAGKVVPVWQFKVHFVVGSDPIYALTSAKPVDEDNDGVTDGIDGTYSPAVKNMVVESTVTYAPIKAFKLKIGRMRIPFTSQAQSANTDLMFPERSGPNETFLSGSDMGALTHTNVFDGRIQASAGVFNGTSTNVFESNRQGILYTGRIDLNPLGAFGFSETSEWAGPLLFGIGAGIIHNPYTAYDSAGYPTVSVQDTRTSLSARASFYGLYVVGEFLNRQQLDSMSSRPTWGSGWYGQAGWHLPKGIEPMFRMGESTVDESFDAQRTTWMDAGLNFYPAAKKARRADQVKVTVHYLNENRVDEGERAQGLSTQVQVSW
jgi:hypothetical protein